jgi:hypothetical protein
MANGSSAANSSAQKRRLSPPLERKMETTTMEADSSACGAVDKIAFIGFLTRVNVYYFAFTLTFLTRPFVLS